MCVLWFVITPYITLPLFVLIVPCLWLQQLRVNHIPTLPILRHLETLQFHPIRARHPLQSPFYQVPLPSHCPPPPFSHTLTLIYFSCTLLTHSDHWASSVSSNVSSILYRFSDNVLEITTAVSKQQIT